ncbi:hypothetical protein HFO97_28890 [Rhizobium leguminosarum]|uniref:hypothetical protein n=1 Tax=Rhizobium leguminosarum TaxID=384 RepID=UPI001C98C907|nr:hypothetical protein [Rhizobium leguminosarum]MBY5363884.1 hypothetical protein [Rhizobium leguminosarum]
MTSAKDFSGRLPPGVPVHLYHGTDDGEALTAHFHLYAKAIRHAVVRTLDGRDHHFNDDMSEVARDIRLFELRLKQFFKHSAGELVSQRSRSMSSPVSA